ncbi:uncharacterized protein LOC120346239 [Styela clava]
MLEDADCKVVTDFMVEYFVGGDPLTTHLQMTPDEGRLMFAPYVKNALWQNVSIGAYHKETGDLVGIVINLLGKNESQLPSLPYVNEKQSIRIRQDHEMILYFFGTSLTTTLGTTKYMELFLTAVRPDNKRRGIATELIKRTENIARQRGMKIITAICTSAYTLRATQNIGFEIKKQITYADYVDPVTGNKILENMEKPHVLLAMIYKKLN